MYQDVLQTILDTKIIAILRGVAPDQLTPLAEVLYQGGIRCIEVTFDQKRADGVRGDRRRYRASLRSHAGAHVHRFRNRADSRAGGGDGGRGRNLCNFSQLQSNGHPPYSGAGDGIHSRCHDSHGDRSGGAVGRQCREGISRRKSGARLHQGCARDRWITFHSARWAAWTTTTWRSFTGLA